MRESVMLRDVARRVDWVLVGGKWTRFSVMGTDLSPSMLSIENKGEDDDRIIILMIPGNPGNEGFYADFGRHVLKNLLEREERIGEKKYNYLFYTVSHLNHVPMPHEIQHSGQHKHHDRFKLDEQVQHKLDFIREYLPRGQRVYLFGHSIGSYMMLKILPYIKDDYNIRKAVGLFPTVERMALSYNGQRLGRLLATLNENDWLAKAISFWVDHLPFPVKRWLVGFNLGQESVPIDLIKVTELDLTLLAHKDITHMYYGTCDGWVPNTYGEAMKDLLPKGHVIFDENDSEHAFVIRDGDIVAQRVINYIN
ncbi:unnamed protein product, partial [Mesorhabditis belari]|uniref:Lipid droplet-associated hydrolase n=1 Tax=Mesorhabditis belari TaxID=2138241 RepID=A0AAF3FMU6_9BILA